MVTFGGFRGVWLMLMFDLPTKTKQEKYAYTIFRKSILKDGFMQIQYSVYGRYCANDENAQVHLNRIKSILPSRGEVRIIQITDKQYERMKVFFGKKSKKPEKAPDQLQFF